MQERELRAHKFVEYALSKPGVYFVTMQTLITWMKHPVPIERIDKWLAKRCNNKGNATISMDSVRSSNGLQFETRAQVSIMAFAGLGIAVAVGIYRMRWSSRLNRHMNKPAPM
jgi:hypothetical protein